MTKGGGILENVHKPPVRAKQKGTNRLRKDERIKQKGGGFLSFLQFETKFMKRSEGNKKIEGKKEREKE